MIATASGDKMVILWDAKVEYPITFRDHKGWVTSVAFPPDSRRVVSASGDRTVMIWDPATGRRLQTFDRHIEWVQAARFTADGRMVASAALAPPILIWDADTLAVYRAFQWVYVPVCLALSPDGRWLAVGGVLPPLRQARPESCRSGRSRANGKS